ncbi:MAG: 30S ribosome-binding factor RbfA [Bradymonadia bacterium]
MSRTNFKRTARVASLLREVLTEVLRTVKDPRVSGVSVTDVEVTGDLREAKVFIACYGEEAAGHTQLEGLTKATSYIRREIGQRIQLRTTPSLSFHLDTSLVYGARIESLLRSIKRDESNVEDTEEDGEQ